MKKYIISLIMVVSVISLFAVSSEAKINETSYCTCQTICTTVGGVTSCNTYCSGDTC